VNPASDERRALREGLDRLHRRGHREHRSRVTRRALSGALESGLWAATVLPIGLLVLALLAPFGGPHPRDIGLWQALAGMLLIAVGVAGSRLWLARSRAIERADVLGECDRLLDSGGRLLAADDFIRTDAEGPFVAAALHEGRDALDRSNDLQFPAPTAAVGIPARAICAGLAALVLAWFVTQGSQVPVEQVAELDDTE
jgi:fumarate reductase subunit D